VTELLTFTIDFAFLCKPIWGTLLYSVSPSSLFLTPFGETAFPRNISGNGVLPLSAFPSTTPLATAVIFKFKNHLISAMPT